MFFYSLLLVASVIMALVVLYLYRMLADVGKAVYRAFLPSAKNDPSNHQNEVKVATSINDTPTPWGWHGQVAQERKERTHTAAPPLIVPWGWKGNGHEIRERGHKPSVRSSVQNGATGLDAFLKRKRLESDSAFRDGVGWPYREEKFELAGKVYKMTRRETFARTDFTTMVKPWGW